MWKGEGKKKKKLKSRLLLFCKVISEFGKKMKASQTSRLSTSRCQMGSTA
jgi:hypothetical protein